MEVLSEVERIPSNRGILGEWNMPKKPLKNSTLDRQKRDVECDEDIIFLLVGQSVT